MTLGGLEFGSRRTPARFGDPEATEWHRLEIVRDDFFRRLALRGRVGFGEAYVAGDFTTPDLPALIALLARNIEVARERDPLTDRHAARQRAARACDLPNTRRRAERKIHYHYDLGNEFYRLFLDESLTYSCAIFEQPGQSLADAQQAKYRRICDRLGSAPTTTCSRSAAAGAASRCTPRASAAAASRASPSRASSTTRRVRARGRRGPRATGSRSSTATSATSRGRTRTSSRSRCSRRSARRCTSRTSRTLDRVLAPGGRALRADDRPARAAVRDATAGRATSSRRTSSPAGTCPRWR